MHSLQWRHNDRDGVSNRQPHDCLLNHLFRRRLKKNFKAPLWSNHQFVIDPCDLVTHIFITDDPLHSRTTCTQPCNVNTHSRPELPGDVLKMAAHFACGRFSRIRVTARTLMPNWSSHILFARVTVFHALQEERSFEQNFNFVTKTALPARWDNGRR